MFTISAIFVLTILIIFKAECAPKQMTSTNLSKMTFEMGKGTQNGISHCQTKAATVEFEIDDIALAGVPGLIIEGQEVQYDVSSEDDKKCFECNCLKKISNKIVFGLENTFYRLGKLVARHPLKTILASLLVCGAASVGLLKWHEETEYYKVWLPSGSRMYDEHIWVTQNFPESVRYEAVIVEDENVLSPQSINAMFNLYNTAQHFNANDKALDDLCIKAGPLCLVNSLLELWEYNETLIRNLTAASISNTINQAKVYSSLYHNVITIDKILGGIQRDNASKIIGARAATMFWYLKQDDKILDHVKKWEEQLIELMNEKGHEHLDKLYIYTSRTFDDTISESASHDLVLLSAGFTFVLIYSIFVMGSCSSLTQKVYLALCGILSIGMAIIFTYGVGFGTGIMFGPIHQITPFMLLGIGVDDMFVMMESLRQLTPMEKKQSVEERIGLTLKHAGVSITVTSITDIVAFAIGGSTVIPSLSTFCVYASIGVFALYILQATYFTACVALDEKRIDDKRNAFLPCYTHKDYRPNKYYNFNIQHLFMKNVLGPLLTTKPAKVIVIVLALGLTAVNTWSFIHLKHDFDTSMYLPTGSYSQKYVQIDRKYFPDDGAFVQMYCSGIDYTSNMEGFLEFYDQIKAKPTIQTTTVDFWLASFLQWRRMTINQSIQSNTSAKVIPLQDHFYAELNKFMLTDQGRTYLRYIKFDNAAHPTKIMASVLTFRHVKCLTAICNIEAMDDMRSLVDGRTFTDGGRCFVYSNPQYMFNETNKVLKLELYRNLALAAICVFVVTLILIANFWTSVLVFICVVCTVIDVAGTMQFWGISIDTASSVLLILCFGLAVDYSAHVGHTFMTLAGTRNERTMKTLVTIGPAVFSGGFSTFLAFLLLVNSISYGFTLFFRIFTSVVIFGLFHGLIFLPVILSLIGPSPYDSKFAATSTKNSDKYTKRTNETKLLNNTNRNNDLTDIQPPNAMNRNIQKESFWKEFDANGDIGNSLSDLPSQQAVLDNIKNDKNRRCSGSVSSGSLINIPYPESPLLGRRNCTETSQCKH